MTSATVFATLVTDAYVNGLIANLVQLGYTVSPGGEKQVVWEGPASALAVIELKREIEGDDYEDLEGDDLDERDVVMRDVKQCLEEMRAKWHSIVIVIEGHFIWDGSNVGTLPSASPIAPPQPHPIDEEPFG